MMKHLVRGAAFVCLLLGLVASLQAEKISDLPAPTAYVSDFAGVLDPTTKQSVEDLCIAVDRQAHAQIAVVTIKTLDGDVSIDDAAVQLEEKWKVGAKGTDRGILMLLVMNPVKGRIEVGYGLEGILNDAKVGDIGRAMAPYSQQGDYNQAIPLGVQRLADVIAKDANVTLEPVQHRYRRVPAERRTQMSPLQVLIFGVVVIGVIVLLASTGNLGILWFILGMFMGGGRGGGGGGGGDDRDGGGFGGFGGGSSGGGGASGNF